MRDPSSPLEVEQIIALHEITSQLNSSLDLNEVLNYVMDKVVEVTKAERGFLMLVSEDTGELHFQVARGMDRQDLDKPEFAVSKSTVEKVVATREALLIFDAERDERINAESAITKNLRSILCVPIQVKDKLIGLVYIDNRVRVGLFQEKHRELLMAFANEAAFAIDNARLYRVAVEKGRLQRELEMARGIQLGSTPFKIYTYQWL